ncbi:MAG: tetratricopeptide repeat protein [Ignavibacteria bacterium]
MQNNFDKYTLKIRSKLDENFLSPLFIRLANLLYANEQYEECISVCKTGLEIYPHYLTAKLILLKAYLKAEYLNEAEILFNEIRSKLPNKEMVSKLQANIQNLKTISRQEKIYYFKSPKNKFDFKSFGKKFHLEEDLFSELSIDNLFDDAYRKKILNEKGFRNFLERFDEFHFDVNSSSAGKINTDLQKAQTAASNSEDLLGKIKIITETLADIYAGQGNYKEAFDAYNILIRAGSVNSKRIEEKLNELERNMLKNDKI